MRTFLFLLVLTFTLGAGVAAAQDTAEQACRATRPGHIECGETILYGRRQAPSAFYLVDRARNLYRAPRVRRDLVGEVRRSVRRTPF